MARYDVCTNNTFAMFGITITRTSHEITEYFGKADICDVSIFWHKMWWKWNCTIEYKKDGLKIEKRFTHENLEDVLLWIKQTSEQLISMESK